ncbi:MAG: hypothetical protein WCT04_22055 [Planctomycetota bacterium]
MKKVIPKCKYCDVEMQVGFTLDRDQGYVAACWVEGVPESSFWGGLSIKGKQWGRIQTFRCEKCGYLENFARRIEENRSMFDLPPS